MTAGDSIILRKEIADALSHMATEFLAQRKAVAPERLPFAGSTIGSRSHHSGLWSRAGVGDVSGCDVAESMSGSAREDFPEDVSNLLLGIS